MRMVRFGLAIIRAIKMNQYGCNTLQYMHLIALLALWFQSSKRSD